MNSKARGSKILQLLQENSSMNVSKLAEYFKTTPTTIRRDLIQLENEQLITRSYGQAHLNPQLFQYDFNIRKDIQAKEKKGLAQAASKLIMPRESIILDSGTTMLTLAEHLKENPVSDVTVLTPSIPIANTLAYNYQVTLPGGMIHAPSMSLIGVNTEEYFRSVRVDKCFVSSTGVFNGIGLSASSQYHITSKKLMIESAGKVIALIDSSKFLITGVNLICEFKNIDTLITFKTEQNEMQLRAIADSGVEVIILDEDV